MSRYFWLLSLSFTCLVTVAADESWTLSKPLALTDGGTMVIYHNTNHEAGGSSLWIHFHGAPATATENFTQAKIKGTLAVINFKGLSAAYSKPFSKSPGLFRDILKRTARQLEITAEEPWKRVTVSSFSAGYGAVRELLKTPQHFERIDAIISADSMYASLENHTDRRQPLASHMRDYQRFAKLATENKKAFLITHTSQETAYASTTETSSYLLHALDITRKQVTRPQSDNLLLTSMATKGKFTVLGYEGITGDDHLQHLRQIHLWWAALDAME